MSAMYFWDGEQVVTFDYWMTQRQVEDKGLTEHPCVDMFANNPVDRYGFYAWDQGWEHQQLNEFPALFRTHLLLMGVS